MWKPIHTKRRSVACRAVALAIALSICGALMLAKPVPALAAAEISLQTQGTIPADALVLDNYLQPGFSCSLPLLIFNSSKADVLPNYENNYSTKTEILTSDDDEGNTLSAAGLAGTMADLHNLTDRDNISDKKHDYFLRFEQETQLLGLPSTREFLVLGAMDDKSLIRNYIGYSIAMEVLDSAPDIRLCELIIRDGDEYLYQGVYLLAALPSAPDSLLLQRSTQGVEMVLETYADMTDETVGELTIPLGEKPGWDDNYNEALGRLSWAEEVLYYTTSRTFYQYQDLFDVESFVGGFIIGELTENYTGMHNAYYYYSSDTEMVSCAPLWSFQYAFDNDAENPAQPDTLRYSEATYFRQLFKSPSFAKQINDSYLQLRRGPLDEQALMRLVDNATALVADAVDRDWARWNGYSHVQLKPLTEIELDDTTMEIEPFSRQSDNYEDEILRIKTQLREHSLHFAVNVTQFDFQEREISKEIVLNSNPVWLIVFIIGFFLVVRFVRKYGV